MINRTGPTNTSESIYHVTPPQVDIDFSESQIAIGVRYFGNYSTVNVRKYFDVEFRLVNIMEFSDQKTYLKNDFLLKAELCRPDHFEHLEDNKLFTDEYLTGNDLMCLKIITLQGQYSSKIYSFLELAVSMCNKADRDDCWRDADTFSSIDFFIVEVYISEDILDMNNFKEPLKKSIRTIYTTTSFKSSKSNSIKIQ